MDFIVLGLPRSATTWLSVWLTTDHSLCLHDPFALGVPETWPRDDRRFGISCTGAYLFPKWLRQFDCPIAIIERDAESCELSLRRAGLGSAAVAALRQRLDKTDGRRFHFDDLWSEDTARDLWHFLLPQIPFDALRYHQLRETQIQPHLGKWRFDPNTAQEMQRREEVA